MSEQFRDVVRPQRPAGKKRQTKEESLAAQKRARIRRERENMILRLQQAEDRLRAEGAEQTVYVGGDDNE